MTSHARVRVAAELIQQGSTISDALQRTGASRRALISHLRRCGSLDYAYTVGVTIALIIDKYDFPFSTLSMIADNPEKANSILYEKHRVTIRMPSRSSVDNTFGLRRVFFWLGLNDTVARE